MKKTMISLTPKLDDRLRGMAKEQEISLSELVRKILQDFIDGRDWFFRGLDDKKKSQKYSLNTDSK